MCITHLAGKLYGNASKQSPISLIKSNRNADHARIVQALVELTAKCELLQATRQRRCPDSGWSNDQM